MSSRLSAVKARTWMPAHFRGRKYVWLYGCVLGVSVLGIAAQFLERWRDGEDVWAGFCVDRTGVVYESAVAGISLGDRVLSWNGQPVRDAGPMIRGIQGMAPGTRVRLELQRESGARAQIALTTEVNRDWFFLWFGLFWLSFALIVFWFRPEGGEAFVVFLMSAVLGFNSISSFGIACTGRSLLSDLVYALSDAVGLWLFVGTGFSFGLLLPYPLPWALRWPLTGWILSLSLVIGSAQAFFELTNHPWIRLCNDVFAIALAGSMLFAIGCMWWRLRQAQSPRTRSQLRLLLLGIALTLPAMGGNLLRYTVGQSISDWTYDACFFFGIGTGAVFVDMLRKQTLLDIDRSSARVIAYGGAVLLVGFLFLVLSLCAPSLLGIEALVANPWGMAAYLLTGAGVFGALVRVVRPRVERSLQRARLTFDARVQAIQSACDLLAAQPLRDCGAHVEAVLAEILGVARVRLLLPGPGPETWLPAEPGRADLPEGPLGVLALRGAGLEWLRPIRLGQETLAALAFSPGSAGSAPPDAEQEAVLEVFGAGAATALSFQQDRRQIGDYQLLGYLGGGGMGAIYLGQRVTLAGSRQKVAIKQLLPGSAFSRKDIDSFLGEMAVSKQLKHPNIVQVEEVGKAAEGYYMAMEYLKGCDGRKLLSGMSQDNRLMDMDLAVYVARRLCAALEYAHRGDPEAERPTVVHRDVTPDNFVVTRDGRIKLMDFGVAAFEDRSAHLFCGKVGYMAPEVLRRDRHLALAPAVDIYSLGIVLYELLTGQHPYRQKTAKDTNEAALSNRWLPVSCVRPEVPWALHCAVAKATRYSPQDRYASMAQFGKELDAIFPPSDSAVARLEALVERYATRHLLHRASGDGQRRAPGSSGKAGSEPGADTQRTLRRP